MNNTIYFSCELDTTDASCALGLEIWLDGQQIYDTSHVQEHARFQHELSDAEAAHVLQFVMKNKQPEHTKISQSGEIVQDARLVIKNITFDEISLGHMFTELATYSHDFNGTGPATQGKFYGEMGCNGTVELKFSTPLYIWLLENM